VAPISDGIGVGPSGGQVTGYCSRLLYVEQDRAIGYDYVRVADAVAEQITAGTLRPGARLPGERGDGPPVPSGTRNGTAAVRELRGRGLVMTLPAKGTYVTAISSASSRK
jgi:GntR family transcriptional regulator